MTGVCDLCGAPIRAARTASVFLDSAGSGAGPCAWLAHDECAGARGMTDRPGRFRWVSVNQLERRGSAADPYSVRPSFEATLAHYGTKEWFGPEHADALNRGHVAAGLLSHPPRRQPANPVGRVSAGSRAVHPERAKMSNALRGEILERDGFRCRRCGAAPTHARLVVDHVTPIALGGKTERVNLQTLCEPCNSGKSDRPPHPHDLEARP